MFPLLDLLNMFTFSEFKNGYANYDTIFLDWMVSTMEMSNIRS